MFRPLNKLFITFHAKPQQNITCINFMVYDGNINLLVVVIICLHLQGRRVKNQDKQSGIKQ
jgi:hypothetical protein